MQISYINVQRNPLLEPKYEFLCTPLISTRICLDNDSLSFQGTKFIRLLDTFARGKWRGKAKLPHYGTQLPWVSQDTSSPHWLKFNHAKHQEKIRALVMLLDKMGLPCEHFQGNLSGKNSLGRFSKGNVMQQLLCCNN